MIPTMRRANKYAVVSRRIVVEKMEEGPGVIGDGVAESREPPYWD